MLNFVNRKEQIYEGNEHLIFSTLRQKTQEFSLEQLCVENVVLKKA